MPDQVSPRSRGLPRREWLGPDFVHPVRAGRLAADEFSCFLDRVRGRDLDPVQCDVKHRVAASSWSETRFIPGSRRPGSTIVARNVVIRQAVLPVLRERLASLHRPELTVDEDPEPGDLSLADDESPHRHADAIRAGTHRHPDRHVVVGGLQDADGGTPGIAVEVGSPSRADIGVIRQGPPPSSPRNFGGPSPCRPDEYPCTPSQCTGRMREPGRALRSYPPCGRIVAGGDHELPRPARCPRFRGSGDGKTGVSAGSSAPLLLVVHRGRGWAFNPVSRGGPLLGPASASSPPTNAGWRPEMACSRESPRRS